MYQKLREMLSHTHHLLDWLDSWFSHEVSPEDELSMIELIDQHAMAIHVKALSLKGALRLRDQNMEGNCDDANDPF